MPKFVDIQSLLKEADISFNALLEEEYFRSFLSLTAEAESVAPDSLYEVSLETGAVFVHPILYVGLRLIFDPGFCFDASRMILDGLTGKYDSLLMFMQENDFSSNAGVEDHPREEEKKDV